MPYKVPLLESMSVHFKKNELKEYFFLPMSQLFINSTGGRQTKERDECSTEQPKISKSQTWIKLLAFSVHPVIKKDKEY